MKKFRIITILIMILSLIAVLAGCGCDAEKNVVLTDPVVNEEHNISEEFNGKNVELKYIENYFMKDSSKYNDDFIRFAMGLSLLTYGTSGSYHDPVENVFTQIKNGEETLYEKVEEKYTDNVGEDQDGTHSPFWIFKRKNPVKMNGKECNIVFVIVRGTTGSEWGSNFETGDDMIHEGFNGASFDIMKYIEKTLQPLNSNKTKILITGHSRGGAVSNILTAKIDDKLGKGVFSNMSKEDVFGYTFATPNVSKSSTTNDEKYSNVINIVNPEDFVTVVMPKKWGYNRYGTTYMLPSISNTNDKEKIKNLHEKVKAKVKELGSTYMPYEKGTKEVDDYINMVTDKIKNNDEYKNKELKENKGETLYKMYNLIGCKILPIALSGEMNVKKIMESGIATLLTKMLLGEYGELGYKTLSFFLSNEVLARLVGEDGAIRQIAKDKFGIDISDYLKKNYYQSFMGAHQGETYFAFLQFLTEKDLLRE